MAKKKEGFFHEAHYAALIQGIFQDAVNKVGNAGQVAILEELFQNSFSALVKAGELQRRPGKGTNRSIMAISISAEKFNAVDEIVEEMADQITQAWDDSYAGDGISEKLFLALTPENFITTIPSNAASMYGFRAAMINGRL